MKIKKESNAKNVFIRNFSIKKAMDHIESILGSLPMILDRKNENNTLEKVRDELFPNENQDRDNCFEKLFKIAFDNCESEERAEELMNRFVKSLGVVTFDELNVIIYLSNDFSIGKYFLFISRF